MSAQLSSWVAQRLNDGDPVILVRVTEARGSTPREAGTVMAVSAKEIRGTIGGGRLEWEAIAEARAMIGEGRATAELDLPLGPAVGQCCGGHARLALGRANVTALEKLAAAEAAEQAVYDQVAVFGAGHVGHALIAALRPLPLRLRWSDQREGVFADAEEVETFSGDPVTAVEALEPGAAVMVMTHDHGLDFAITEAALQRADLAYVGMIGSQTKARRFERWFVARGNNPRRLDDLISPIGETGPRDKRPAVIAALAAAEILTSLADYKREQQGGAARFGGAGYSGKAGR